MALGSPSLWLHSVRGGSLFAEAPPTGALQGWGGLLLHLPAPLSEVSPQSRKEEEKMKAADWTERPSSAPPSPRQLGRRVQVQVQIPVLFLVQG